MSIAEPDEMEKLLNEIHKTIQENRQFLKKLADDDDDDGAIVNNNTVVEKVGTDEDDFEEL